MLWQTCIRGVNWATILLVTMPPNQSSVKKLCCDRKPISYRIYYRYFDQTQAHVWSFCSARFLYYFLVIGCVVDRWLLLYHEYPVSANKFPHFHPFKSISELVPNILAYTNCGSRKFIRKPSAQLTVIFICLVFEQRRIWLNTHICSHIGYVKALCQENELVITI